MTVTFARESLTDALWDEALPLLHAHWKEIARFPDIELAPDRGLYASSEAAGILRCFTARDVRWQGHSARVIAKGIPGCSTVVVEGYECSNTARDADIEHALVGYALYFVRPAPHYRHSVQAVQDVLFLDKSVRGGTGYKFIAFCDQQLAAEGVQCTYQHVKLAKDFGPLLVRQGYEAVETIYVKRLDLPSFDRKEAERKFLYGNGDENSPPVRGMIEEQFAREFEKERTTLLFPETFHKSREVL